MSEAHARPTRVRYVIVAVTVLMALVLYLDRFCVSFVERYIKEDFGLTETQTAWFLSLFFWSYALGQVPSGWLADRFGIRGVLTFYIVSWSLFTGLLGVAGGVVALLALRLGCGLAQAGAYPAAGSLLSKWVPLSGRGLASALAALGGRAGGAVAPILTAYLMVMFVPLSTSALLEDRHLFDPVGVCARLAEHDARPDRAAERRFRELWPAGTSSQLDELAGRCLRLLARQKELLMETKTAGVQEGDPADSPRGDELAQVSAQIEELRRDPAVARLLCDGLNAVLRRPDLYREQDFSRLKSMEREALQFLERRDGGQSLSELEVTRLNRLLLEAVFPAEVAKLYVRGWRPVVIVYGVAGVIVAVLFWFCFRNSPAEHPLCNAAERALIAAGKATDHSPESAEPLPLGAILRSRSLWLSSISQFGTNVGWLFLVTYLARYLLEVHEVPILQRSWMAAIPPIAGIAGTFLGGQVTDWLTRRIGLRWGRALPMGATRFLAAAFYIACLWLDSPWAATIAFAGVFFFTDLGVSAVWAFMQDVGGKQVASILGWGNMWGNIGAAVAPQIYNLVLGEQPGTPEWNTMFLVCAGMFILAGVTALGIDATVPVRAEPPENDAAR